MTGWDVLLLIIVASAILLVGLPIAVFIRLGRGHGRSTVPSSPRLQKEARVIDKRTQLMSIGTRAPQRYFVTFQLPDGDRIELAVPTSQAGMLVVGDEGRLDWQGSRYLGFAREILR